MIKNMCVNCKEREIYIKKRGLCHKCYARLYREGMTQIKDPKSGVTIKKVKHGAEISFIKNFFTDDEWIYEPCLFYVNGAKYTPDFYDKKRNAFIEVAATRQAYSYNKEKYEKLTEMFPKIVFEIRTPDGELLSNKHGEKWRYQNLNGS